ncbi:hypothetical protein O181_120785 [Austropuccinia psidii MF-1]|uniref:Uncharacterized protein n=1 Tax=Austropuccinia psidii MF-1 TaxID=1389203 RepID=A0A9Q3KGE6_9BASI|nr:hypothetical protein [Austropuccinia psidii MF-1]
MDAGNNQRTPVNLKRGFPSRSGKPLAQLNRPKPVGTISGAYMVLYTIMHHFTSEIHYCTSNQVPNQSSISKEGFRPSVLQSMTATRR